MTMFVNINYFNKLLGIWNFFSRPLSKSPDSNNTGKTWGEITLRNLSLMKNLSQHLNEVIPTRLKN